MILLLILYSCVAASFTLAKLGLLYAPPIFFVAVRMLIAGPLFLIFDRIRTKKWPTISRPHIPLFLFTGFIHIYLTFVCDLVALQYMSSFKGAFLYSFSPFIAVFFSYRYFSEKLTIKKLVGLLIGFFGFIYELMFAVPAKEVLCLSSFLSRADVLMLCSVFASMYGWTLVRVLMKKGYAPTAVNGYAMLFGGTLSLVTSLCTEQLSPSPVTLWYPFLISTIAVIIVSNVISYGLYGYLLHYYTTTFLSFAGMLSPAIAALFGSIFLGETVTISFFISTTFVALGLFLFYSEEIRQGYIKPKS